MAKNQQRKFDAAAQQRFLQHYAEFGLYYRAAAAADVCTMTVDKHRKDHPEFEQAYQEARAAYKDAVEEEIRRRSIEGVEEYYVTGKGHVVMDPFSPDPKNPRPLKKRVYSDRLLELHAKRHIPEYREKQTVDHNVRGGVLLIPAKMSVEEWQEQQAKIPTPQPIDVARFGLPAPVESED